ncbi:uncharacterized protein LOC112553054 [Pogonomyrmex barbatus]|uniref:Uncharacterized protein LOC112553054 n=1 Tax=Pogonomyrmex barbatus TaxID=144034 RepID=A0A8N1SBY8_9HYME|nr:uncharacterized protein LOC112553054 [Pogonomyrmex barbatus]
MRLQFDGRKSERKSLSLRNSMLSGIGLEDLTFELLTAEQTGYNGMWDGRLEPFTFGQRKFLSAISCDDETGKLFLIVPCVFRANMNAAWQYLRKLCNREDTN